MFYSILFNGIVKFGLEEIHFTFYTHKYTYELSIKELRVLILYNYSTRKMHFDIFYLLHFYISYIANSILFSKSFLKSQRLIYMN